MPGTGPLTNSTLATPLLVSMGPRPYLSFCACKKATLGPDLQVCMDPRPHLRF